MTTHEHDSAGARSLVRRGDVRALSRQAAAGALTALERLAGGTGTAVLALLLLGWLLVVAVLCVLGVGVLLAPAAVRALHTLADRERDRLSRWGPQLVGPDAPPARLRPALAHPTVRRELRWLVRHATLGLLTGLAGLLLPLFAVRDLTFPLWWRLAPADASMTSLGFGTADGWPEAVSVGLMGVGWVAIIVGLAPAMARAQASPGRRLLPAGAETDVALRIAELTASRAAALDAHAAELRRIERALHDGTQNRLVAATVLLGAARRMVERDPSQAGELLERAHGAAEQALAELRSVVRGILPPVLADRGLAGALTGLAASCPVPCQLDVDVPARCAASVEATAYFAVAEALTNVAKHSGASRVTVTVRAHDGRLRLRVADDGRGGAAEDGGSGLAGVRRRVAAHDGTLTVTSPPGGPTTLEVELPCGS
ncbi:sensor histidine kinase [Streptomyces sp. 7-21]|uniref:sensor histidine kinase n=1 Tax=Streptomyces sp. 7-21 TaxID=2802283 RepID=UPI00191E7C74|nr:sensor histidine kinase [Streptomyces sp. 7-21]MBL1067878.1 sensor histidine kinase [Streptomyces sp. 7-21]